MGIFAERRRGFDGNSMKRAAIGSEEGFADSSCSIIVSSVAMSESRPCPRK